MNQPDPSVVKVSWKPQLATLRVVATVSDEFRTSVVWDRIGGCSAPIVGGTGDVVPGVGPPTRAGVREIGVLGRRVPAGERPLFDAADPILFHYQAVRHIDVLPLRNPLFGGGIVTQDRQQTCTH